MTCDVEVPDADGINAGWNDYLNKTLHVGWYGLIMWAIVADPDVDVLVGSR